MTIQAARSAIDADLASLDSALSAINAALAGLGPPDTLPSGGENWDAGPGLARRKLNECAQALERTRSWRVEAQRAAAKIPGGE